MVNGKVYMETRLETVEENGTKTRKPIKHPIRHWYWRDSEGHVRFSIRVFNKRIELANDKMDVLVGDDRELPAIVKKLLDAASAGEFDEHLKQAVARRKTK